VQADNTFKWQSFGASSNIDEAGESAYSLIKSLYPINRSITGDGNRETLQIISNEIDLKVHEVPSGTEVFDWLVPDEWNVRAAYIETLEGTRVIDFNDSNLHLMSYSEPVDAVLTLDDLNQHLTSIPEYPDWIPYRTSYYNRTWGFCLTENQRKALNEEKYHVVIDTDFKKGSLTYGEYFVKGESSEEFLIFAHICHPSLCNDNLSGISIAVEIAKILGTKKLNRSYRIVFAPATIGSITWIHQNYSNLQNIKAGLVIAVAGDAGGIHYKKNRNKDSYIDKLVINTLNLIGKDFDLLEFSPYGYDERQFGSPGVNLPVGSFMRTPNGCFPEYHTSGDNLDFVNARALSDSIDSVVQVLNVFDNNVAFQNLSPYGEPQMGKRGLYRKTGGLQSIEDSILAKLWVLNLSDGENDLLDISIRSNINFEILQDASKELFDAGLLQPIIR
jgi:aminopeptidase-like protein